MPAQQKLYVVIVGCGRFGASLANRLSADGHSVVAIDVRESAFGGLSDEFSGFRIEGDATELAVLRQAKAAQADLLIAATREDNVNLMVAQVAAKILHVPRVIARVFDPRREALFAALGLEAVCPTSLAVDELTKSIAAPPAPPKQGAQP